MKIVITGIDENFTYFTVKRVDNVSLEGMTLTKGMRPDEIKERVINKAKFLVELKSVVGMEIEVEE